MRKKQERAQVVPAWATFGQHGMGAVQRRLISVGPRVNLRNSEGNLLQPQIASSAVTESHSWPRSADGPGCGRVAPRVLDCAGIVPDDGLRRRESAQGLQGCRGTLDWIVCMRVRVR